ncbi:MAG: MarR family winged helix-turn-helix transcriptional regulator [Rhodothermaceae bacterium]
MANKSLIINSDLELKYKVQALLLCIASEQTADLTKKIKPFNLSLTQLQILHNLSFAPEGKLTVNQIKSLMIDESPNVSRSLNKLMENGHIVKERNFDDQRVVHISITKSGRKVHIDADKAMIGSDLDLTEKELEQLYKLLVKI